MGFGSGIIIAARDALRNALRAPYPREMRPKTLFECTGCGHQEPKWLGRCPSCGKWNSFSEVAGAALPARGSTDRANGKGLAIPLSSIETREGMRLDTGIAEMNRVLGGGSHARVLRPRWAASRGSASPRSCSSSPHASQVRGRSLYVSGEESPGSFACGRTGSRVSSERIEVLAETELTAIMQVLEQVKPVLIIVDSLQTLYTREVNALPGTVNQIKVCTQELVDWARSRGAACSSWRT